MEKQSVEDSFKNAFHEAEMHPSSEVWTHIELGIEKEEGAILKRRVVFYRWMAAASILLAVSLLGGSYFTSTTYQNPLALNNQAYEVADGVDKVPNTTNQVVPVEVNPDVSEFSNPSQTLTKENSNSKENQLTNSNDAKVASTINRDFNSLLKSNAAVSSIEMVSLVDKADVISPKYAKRTPSPLPPLVVQRPYRIQFPKTEPDQIDLLLAAIEMEEKEIKKKRSVTKETLWTSLTMAAGSYSPVISSSSNNSPIFALDAGSLSNGQLVNVSSQVEASGYSFSSGISVGGKVADRWIVQGGVNYLTQNSNFSSNAVLVDRANNLKLASLNTLNAEAYNGFIQSSSLYMVNSTLKYFNVPLQAGYLIINKAFGWQMQGGFSTDFFLQNTLSAEDAGLDRVSQGSGDDSPYRTVNFSGLLGTEVSYRFGEHYRVALNPGIRYPFQSVYKSELGVRAAPITFDVGLKFHYIFK